MPEQRVYQRSDFTKARGTAETRVNLITGERVSRREYQRQIGQPLPKYDREGNRKDKRTPSAYVRMIRNYSATHGISRRQAQQDPQVKSRWKHLRDLWRLEKKGELVDRSAQGDMALTMAELDMRPSGSTYDVGDTP